MKQLIEGNLIYENLKDKVDYLANLVATNQDVSLDLSKLEIIDTAGLSLLIELKCLAKFCNHKLRFENCGNQIITLCQLYKVNL